MLSSRGSVTLSAEGSLLGLECLLDGVFGHSSVGMTSSYTGGVIGPMGRTAKSSVCKDS